MSDKVNLHDTVNAKVWTNEFMKAKEKNPNIPNDWGTMLGWFANAIMAGHDHAMREISVHQDTPQEE